MDILVEVVLGWVLLELVYYGLKHFKVFPILKVERLKHFNGKNGLLSITMDKETVRDSNPFGEAIFAQEYREFYHSSLILVRVIESFVPKVQRMVEYKGHALEVVWAADNDKELDIDAYWKEEAFALQYYEQFEGMSLSEIEKELRLYENDARHYMDVHKYDIKRMYGKIKDLN